MHAEGGMSLPGALRRRLLLQCCCADQRGEPERQRMHVTCVHASIVVDTRDHESCCCADPRRRTCETRVHERADHALDPCPYTHACFHYMCVYKGLRSTHTHTHTHTRRGTRVPACLYSRSRTLIRYSSNPSPGNIKQLVSQLNLN
jgi:hypothetical protein